MGMHREHRDLAHGGHTVIYFGDWHTGRGGHQERRIISITVEMVAADRLIPTRVPRWSVVATQQSSGTAGSADVVSEVTTDEGNAALVALGEAMQQAVRDGFAHKADLERVPRPAPAVASAAVVEPPAPRRAPGAHRATR